jgi:hypothetical protein
VGEVSGVDVGERQLLWANNPTELNALTSWTPAINAAGTPAHSIGH